MTTMNTLSLISLDAGPGITAFSTLRGCTSDDSPYSGFNACHYTGDDPRHVKACRSALCKELGISECQLIIPRQTHSTNVATIGYEKPMLENVDALVTRRTDVALCINTADCVPVVMSDANARVIAVAHSGWRGTVGRIAARTVEAMTRLGASPHDIIVAMGPCICPECFEVGDEVVEAFATEFPDAGEIIIPRTPRSHIDLAAAIRHTLVEAGVPESSIIGPTACSHCNPDKLFSARTHGIASGRTLTVAKMTRDAPISQR